MRVAGRTRYVKGDKGGDPSQEDEGDATVEGKGSEIGFWGKKEEVL